MPDPKEPQSSAPPHPLTGAVWGKIYDCGCKAYGGKDLPDYCSNHGHPPIPKPEDPSEPPPDVDPGG